MDTPKRLLKVLFLPADDGGCGYHRIRMWDQAFNRLKIADSILLDPSEDEKETRLAIESADIIVGKFGTLEYIKFIKRVLPNKVVVFDNDDNTLEIKPSNPAYKSFGTRDVWVPHRDVTKTEYYQNATVGIQLKMEEQQAIPLWVTGITPGFNRFNNVSVHTGLIESLLISDVTTSPTPTLSEFWSKYADTTAVIPNCLDFSYYPDVEVKRKRRKGEIRMGWSGGSSHSADWKAVKPVVLKMLEDHPEVTLVTVGSNYPEHFKGLKNVEHHPWTKWEAHPYRMKMLDLDFALIPLADDESFNIYKSELKFSEFAALRVPVIVKDQLPYSPYIKRNENCLAYKDNKELEKCIEIMLKDKELRNKLSENAYKWVRQERDIDKVAPNVVALYKSFLPSATQELIN